MFSCSNNLDLNNATLTTAHTVDGVDAKPATDKQPRHQMLSHRIHPFSFSGDLQLARMPVLRLSGDSEALLRAVILKPHQQCFCHYRITGFLLHRLPVSALGAVRCPRSGRASSRRG